MKLQAMKNSEYYVTFSSYFGRMEKISTMNTEWLTYVIRT